jgi:hypothetical protein
MQDLEINVDLVAVLDYLYSEKLKFEEYRKQLERQKNILSEETQISKDGGKQIGKQTELECEQYLIANNIPYKKNIEFKDLLTKNRLGEFDFIIPGAVIEVKHTKANEAHKKVIAKIQKQIKGYQKILKIGGVEDIMIYVYLKNTNDFSPFKSLLDDYENVCFTNKLCDIKYDKKNTTFKAKGAKMLDKLLMSGPELTLATSVQSLLRFCVLNEIEKILELKLCEKIIIYYNESDKEAMTVTNELYKSDLYDALQWLQVVYDLQNIVIVDSKDNNITKYHCDTTPHNVQHPKQIFVNTEKKYENFEIFKTLFYNFISKFDIDTCVSTDYIILNEIPHITDKCTYCSKIHWKYAIRGCNSIGDAK